MIGSVIQQGMQITVRDEHGHQLCSKTVNSTSVLQGYTSNCWTVRTGRQVTTYDEHGHQLDSRTI